MTTPKTVATLIACACTNEFLSVSTQEDADNGEACCATCYAEIMNENARLHAVEVAPCTGCADDNCEPCNRAWAKAEADARAAEEGMTDEEFAQSVEKKGTN